MLRHVVQYGLLMHACRARLLKQDGQDHSPVDEASGCRVEFIARDKQPAVPIFAKDMY